MHMGGVKMTHAEIGIPYTMLEISIFSILTNDTQLHNLNVKKKKQHSAATCSK